MNRMPLKAENGKENRETLFLFRAILIVLVLLFELFVAKNHGTDTKTFSKQSITNCYNERLCANLLSTLSQQTTALNI